MRRISPHTIRQDMCLSGDTSKHHRSSCAHGLFHCCISKTFEKNRNTEKRIIASIDIDRSIVLFSSCQIRCSPNHRHLACPSSSGPRHRSGCTSTNPVEIGHFTGVASGFHYFLFYACTVCTPYVRTVLGTRVSFFGPAKNIFDRRRRRRQQANDEPNRQSSTTPTSDSIDHAIVHIFLISALCLFIVLIPLQVEIIETITCISIVFQINEKTSTRAKITILDRRLRPYAFLFLLVPLTLLFYPVGVNAPEQNAIRQGPSRGNASARSNEATQCASA